MADAPKQPQKPAGTGDAKPRTLPGVGKVVPVSVNGDLRMFTLDELRRYQDSPEVKVASWQEYEAAHRESNPTTGVLETITGAGARGVSGGLSDVAAVGATEFAAGKGAARAVKERLLRAEEERPGLSTAAEIIAPIVEGGVGVARGAMKATKGVGKVAAAARGAEELATVGKELATAEKAGSAEKAAASAVRGGEEAAAVEAAPGKKSLLPERNEVRAEVGGPLPPSGGQSPEIPAVLGRGVPSAVAGDARAAEEIMGPGQLLGDILKKGLPDDLARRNIDVARRRPDLLERALEKWRMARKTPEEVQALLEQLGPKNDAAAEILRDYQKAAEEAARAGVREGMAGEAAAIMDPRRDTGRMDSALRGGAKEAEKAGARGVETGLEAKGYVDDAPAGPKTGLEPRGRVEEGPVSVKTGLEPRGRVEEGPSPLPSTKRMAESGPRTGVPMTAAEREALELSETMRAEAAEAEATLRAAPPPARPGMPERYNGPLTDRAFGGPETSPGGPFPGPRRPSPPEAFAKTAPDFSRTMPAPTERMIASAKDPGMLLRAPEAPAGPAWGGPVPPGGPTTLPAGAPPSLVPTRPYPGGAVPDMGPPSMATRPAITSEEALSETMARSTGPEAFERTALSPDTERMSPMAESVPAPGGPPAPPSVPPEAPAMAGAPESVPVSELTDAQRMGMRDAFSQAEIQEAAQQAARAAQKGVFAEDVPGLQLGARARMGAQEDAMGALGRQVGELAHYQSPAGQLQMMGRPGLATPERALLDTVGGELESAQQKLARAISDARGVYDDITKDPVLMASIQAPALQFEHDVFRDREYSQPAMIAAGVMGALGAAGLGTLGKHMANRSAAKELAKIGTEAASTKTISDRVGFIEKTLQEMAIKRVGMDKKSLQGIRKLGLVDDVGENLVHEFKKFSGGKSLSQATNQEIFDISTKARETYSQAIGALIKEGDIAAASGRWTPPPASKMVSIFDNAIAELEPKAGSAGAVARLKAAKGEWMRTQGMLLEDGTIDINKAMDLNAAKDFSNWLRTITWGGKKDPDVAFHLESLAKARNLTEHHLMEELDKMSHEILSPQLQKKYQFAKRKFQSWKYIADSSENHVVDNLLQNGAGDSNIMAKFLGRAGYGYAIGGDPVVAVGAAAASLMPEWWKGTGRNFAFHMLDKAAGGLAIKAEREALMDAIQNGAEAFVSQDIPATRAVSRLSNNQAAKAMQAVRKLQNDPQALAAESARAAEPVMAISEENGVAAMQGIQRALGLLAAKLPKTIWDADGGVAAKANYNPWEIRNWLEYYETVTNPASVVESAKHGYVSDRQVEALETMSPELLEAIRQQYILKAGQKGIKGVRLSMPKQVAFSKILGRPMSMASSPQTIAANQLTYTQLGGQKGGPGGAGPMGGGGGTAPQSFGQMFATPGQKFHMK